ncbi:MAG: Wzz/FepE/Etk N-terminal domain-containing protein, partial [Bacillaceae bacterium]|nr:Wzz/FepE/Etk N-terminal domain-containing protein [Bacillaceae bacterium]
MNQQKAKEIELRKIVLLLIRKMWIVILITIITTTLAALYQSKTKPTPLYQTSTSLLISDSTGFINTLRVFAKEAPVLEEVRSELNISRSADSIGRQIHLDAVQNSQIVKITVTDADPEQSAQIANTTATVLINQVNKRFGFENIEIISLASVKGNEYPINPQSNRLIQIGILFGVVVGIGLILLLDSLDNKIK